MTSFTSLRQDGLSAGRLPLRSSKEASRQVRTRCADSVFFPLTCRRPSCRSGSGGRDVRYSIHRRL